MFASLLVRQALKITRISPLQCRGYLRKNRDEFKPLIKFPRLKDSTHFKRDRINPDDAELIYRSPQMSSELAPAIALTPNLCFLSWLGWSWLNGNSPTEPVVWMDPEASGLTILPQNTTDLVVGSVVFTAIGIATYLYAKSNIMRIYYHVEREHFIASHCSPFWNKTRTTIIQPGAPKPSRLSKDFLAIPGLMIPQYVDPESFRTPEYYNAFIGTGPPPRRSGGSYGVF